MPQANLKWFKICGELGACSLTMPVSHPNAAMGLANATASSSATHDLIMTSC